MNQKLIQKSKKFYAFLLKLYPETYKREFGEEMKYVFSQSLKDAYAKNRLQGIIREWLKTVLDASKSIINEHLENFKGGNSMKTNNKDIIMQNKIFLWIALAVGLLLLIPLFLTLINISNGGIEGQGWYWKLGDFVFAFAMFFGFSSLFILAARKWQKNRLFIGLAIAAVFLLIWVHLAVGIVDTWPLAGS